MPGIQIQNFLFHSVLPRDSTDWKMLLGGALQSRNCGVNGHNKYKKKMAGLKSPLNCSQIRELEKDCRAVNTFKLVRLEKMGSKKGVSVMRVCWNTLL